MASPDSWLLSTAFELDLPCLSFATFCRTISFRGFPGGASGKESAPNTGDARAAGLISGSGRSPGGGQWKPTPVFLPGKFHGQRSLAGYSPWGCKDQTQLSSVSFRKSSEMVVPSSVCPIKLSSLRVTSHTWDTLLSFLT